MQLSAIEAIFDTKNPVYQFTKRRFRYAWAKPLFLSVSASLTAGTVAAPMTFQTVVDVPRDAMFILTDVRYVAGGTLTNNGVLLWMGSESLSFANQYGEGVPLRFFAGVGQRPFTLPYPHVVRPGNVVQVVLSNTENTSGTCTLVLGGIAIYLEEAPTEFKAEFEAFRNDYSFAYIRERIASLASNVTLPIYVGGASDASGRNLYITTWLGNARDTVADTDSNVYITPVVMGGQMFFSLEGVDSRNLLGVAEYTNDVYPHILGPFRGLEFRVENRNANAHSLEIELFGVSIKNERS